MLFTSRRMDEQMDVDLVISEDARHYKVFLVFYRVVCVCQRVCVRVERVTASNTHR